MPWSRSAACTVLVALAAHPAPAAGSPATCKRTLLAATETVDQRVVQGEIRGAARIRFDGFDAIARP